MSDRFPDVDWYCDSCDAYLNDQAGFDDHRYTWKCTECGYKSSISRDNIREEDDTDEFRAEPRENEDASDNSWSTAWSGLTALWREVRRGR